MEREGIEIKWLLGVIVRPSMGEARSIPSGFARVCHVPEWGLSRFGSSCFLGLSFSHLSAEELVL